MSPAEKSQKPSGAALKKTFRIGTRGSSLALYQAHFVRDLILQAFPDSQVEIIKIATTGDVSSERPQNPLETKRIFTKEIEAALLARDVDLAVHSAKDVAVDLPPGTRVGAVPRAADPRDCLLTADGRTLADLPAGAVVGTTSLRRQRQLLRGRPDLKVESVRGNVETRIRKMTEGQFDAIILAYAGLTRLGLTEKIAEVFNAEDFYPAPGQGVLLIQCREDDDEVVKILGAIHHPESAARLACERAFLKRLEGGCQLPCGITTHIHAETMTVKGALFDLEGSGCAEAEVQGNLSAPEETGGRLAEAVLENGGREIREKIRAK